MITPSFGLTATERVLPRLALDFTTAALDPRVTFTRSGNTATVINSSGVIVAINANLPRFDFNPTTLVCRGLLIEETRTNALVNSLIDGTDLATQLVTVTAAARTLSFYGTGTVVLSGAHSATVVGTGAYPIRTTLTFTPSAGVLTLTVTGTVQFAQLEAGAFATSFIPTAATSVIRNADVATMTSTNFSDWYNATEGTFSFEGSIFVSQGATTIDFLQASNGVSNSFSIDLAMFDLPAPFFGVSNATSQASLDLGTLTLNSIFKMTGTYKLDSFAGSINGGAAVTDNLGTIPTGIVQLGIGNRLSGQYMNGHARKVSFWPQRLTNAEVQAFSK